MVAHVVLYRPRPETDVAVRRAFLAALADAPRRIPAIRRFWIGRRITDGPGYRLGEFPDFPFMAVIEFDDRAGLEAYLAHESHQDVGRLFNETAEAALIYDFEMFDADRVDQALESAAHS